MANGSKRARPLDELFPMRWKPIEPEFGEARVVPFTDEDADDMFAVLTSSTTRVILGHLYDAPATAPELRDKLDTSLQLVHYHLGKLEDAGLIQPCGGKLSRKGTEMTVFAPSREAVVLVAGVHECNDAVTG